MKFSIKTLSAAFALTLAAAGSAGATSLCSLHLPGMGCPGASLSGEADSTTHGFVGPQGPMRGPAPWLPPQQTDTLTQALIAANAGQLPWYSNQAAPSQVPPPGFFNNFAVVMSLGCGYWCESLLYSPATQSYAVYAVQNGSPGTPNYYGGY